MRKVAVLLGTSCAVALVAFLGFSSLGCLLLATWLLTSLHQWALTGRDASAVVTDFSHAGDKPPSQEVKPASSTTELKPVRCKINRSTSVPKGFAGCYAKIAQHKPVESADSAENAARSSGFDPKQATKERRQRLKAHRESSLRGFDSLELDDGPSPFQRNVPIRASGRTNGVGSTGDLTDIGKEDDQVTSLPDIKQWQSCGNLKIKGNTYVIDSYDGLHQILTSDLLKGAVSNSTGGSGPQSPTDEKSSTMGSTVNLHFSVGTLVRVENSSEVQIGDHNVMKVERSKSDSEVGGSTHGEWLHSRCGGSVLISLASYLYASFPA